MRIVSLMDNISQDEKLCAEHGLSLWIETSKYKILFDFGASEAWVKNAETLNIDVSQADFAVLSHGHYDHSGGLKAFLALNQQAKIYLNVNAFEEHWALRQSGSYESIGIGKQEEVDSEHIVYCEGLTRIDSDFILFSEVQGKDFYPIGNRSLFMGSKESLQPEDFRHEQNLVFYDEQKWYLISGCAHKGIVNIIEAAKELIGAYPDEVFGGFHLHNKSTGSNESPEQLKALSEALLATRARYHTGHCTGIVAYEEMKCYMKEKLEYFSCGTMYREYKKN